MILLFILPDCKIAKNPIVFVHGNSDYGLRNPDNKSPLAMFQTGWTKNLKVSI